MRLYFIRHGQTDWNLTGRIQGSLDIPLNENGRNQAERLTKAMKERPVTAVFSSPMKRAAETARWVAESASSDEKVPVIYVKELSEISYGDWEGQTMEEILENHGEEYEKWWKDPENGAPPGGESMVQIMERCKTAWEKILKEAKGDVAVVSHGAVLEYLFFLVSGRKIEEETGVVDNASITSFEYSIQTKQAVLLEWNFKLHLFL